MTSFKHTPAVEAAEIVELQKLVEQQATRDRAVVIFSKPTCNTKVAIERDDPNMQVLYGGMALQDGEWWNFVLRPNAGFEDVLVQKGKFKGATPSVRFAKKFGYEAALIDMIDIHKALNGEGINMNEEDEAFMLGEDFGGWNHVFVR